MRQRKIALTGPAAAAVYGLDGFRDHAWRPLWCVPNGSNPGDRLIQVRDWRAPNLVEDHMVAPIGVVLRHLHAVPSDLNWRGDRLTPIDRIEHAYRLGIGPELARGSRQAGDRLLREIVARRGAEPPTESYAETRALQLIRSLGREPWRQIQVRPAGRGGLRSDFMVPFRAGPRPQVVLPGHGLLVEIDSREFHERQFEKDHRRGSELDQLGYHWIVLTPNQIEFQSKEALRAIDGALGRAVELAAGISTRMARS